MNYLIVVAVAYLIAQVSKIFIAIVVDPKNMQKVGFTRLFLESGGMPSGHSATVVSLALIIGFQEGWKSAIFALATIFAIIVMYDAMKVRRATGELGDAVSKIMEKLPGKKPFYARGHKPFEVFIGALIGIAVACAANYLW